MLSTLPDQIDFDAQDLHIRWKDGKECRLGLLALRRNCPCAVCRGGHEADARPTTGGIESIALLSWKKVGRYALQLNWSDGHDTGIYTYDHLRERCNEKPQKIPRPPPFF
ncbi:MAG: DUF971 domain-containing protein [Leptospirales bacterium]|nr:DUF971 domain-containing protein [Leptospirales bacterium]